MNREENLCWKCGAEAIDGLRICLTCAKNIEKKRISNRDYYTKHRQALIEASRKQRQVRSEQGRCVRCGKPLTEDDEGKYCSCRTFDHSDLRIYQGESRVNMGFVKGDKR